MKQIALSKGLFATVDDSDFDELCKHNWGAHKNGRHYYAARVERGGRIIKMHRQILGLTDPKIFSDHISGDTLDNRRCNLRAVTPLQNAWNKTWKDRVGPLPRGVYKRGGKYFALINHMRSKIEIGSFDTPEEAAAAYKAKAKELRGEFMRAEQV